MALINAGDSAHDLTVKRSPCTYSCPGWRNDCNLLAYMIPGEDLATYTLSSLVTNLAVCIANQQCTARSGSPHDDQSSD